MAQRDFGAIVLRGGAPGEHTAAAIAAGVVQPFPTFSEAFLPVLRDLDRQVRTPLGAP
ncbi:hypothetical protein [Amycolatopsis solani]|uniref:hypothetical protein n=1 Tax=Amycolatopsis solani TaxID=3028615 RepID=UPI0025AFDE60|nr:hypothetical protein [Amycolatopsis sp. MEP2-6]